MARTMLSRGRTRSPAVHPTMDAFSPDFTPYWTTARETVEQSWPEGEERRSAGDEQALADLDERILAARSVV